MNQAFVTVLNSSFSASIVVIAVLALKLCMKKAPRWISAALWLFVAARLVFPFALESELSIIPTQKLFSTTYVSDSTITMQTGLTAQYNPLHRPVSTVSITGNTFDIYEVLALVWLIGLAVMVIYGFVSYILLYRKVSTAIPLMDNVYQSEYVKSPFVLGFIRPKIYVPFNMDENTLGYVLAHENAHIKRKDHITKPLAYMLLSVHWFNPLIWLSYCLLCRDIEVACDEKVIKDLSLAGRKCYALALLNCKVKNATMAVCPVAFGEVSVSSRIKKTLKYKKPAMWIVGLAVAVCVMVSGCLLTSPKAEVGFIQEDIAVITDTPCSTDPAESEPTTTAAIETEALVLTEPVTEAVTESYEEYYEEYYYEDDYYYEDYYYYEEETWPEIPPLEIQSPVPSWIDDGNTYEHHDSVIDNQSSKPSFPDVIYIFPDPQNPESINSNSIW